MKSGRQFNLVTICSLLIGMVLASNCMAATSRDPYETYNRSAYRFNQTVDQIILAPTARAYDKVIPSPVKKGIGNFFDNLACLPTIANNLLQANLGQAVGGTWRFVINSTLGILGLFDVASHLGMPKYYTDFGITLQKWGMKPTSYLVLPLLGASSVSDALALPIDYQFAPNAYVNPRSISYQAMAVNIVNTRAQLLQYGDTEAVALDPYVFRRNVYIQQRHALLLKARGQADQQNLASGYDFAND
jgi:phospholipid-binding lipoprotein MlaA